MPIQALILVLAAAALHTWWNYLVKTVTEKQVFTWWTLAVGCIFYVPLVLLDWPVPVRIWPYAVASALAETIYFIALVRAYEQGDFSLVYPVARGAAPAMLAVWALLFLGERPEPGGMVGLFVLIVGLILVGGAGLIMRRSTVSVGLSEIFGALAVAFWISVYSAIDGAAIRIMAPRGYAGLILALTALFLAPVIISRHGPRAMAAELRAHWFRILAVAFLMLVTFIFVLDAFRLAKVSYVAAVREMSVILAALAGWRFMGEEFGPVRTAGAVLIFLGILLVALVG
jgi:drug/metabolite transporter (DMT)-like permease